MTRSFIFKSMINTLHPARVQHHLKLCNFAHARDAVATEGSNINAASNAAADRIVAITSAARVHIYRIAAARAEAVVPAPLLHLAHTLRPAQLRLQQTIDSSEHGRPSAVAAGVAH